MFGSSPNSHFYYVSACFRHLSKHITDNLSLNISLNKKVFRSVSTSSRPWEKPCSTLCFSIANDHSRFIIVIGFDCSLSWFFICWMDKHTYSHYYAVKFIYATMKELFRTNLEGTCSEAK